MSLQHAAQLLAAKGRNGDSHLVHMSTGEIRGLQDLARMHGTSLTTNPHTGLPEAFSLKSFLPAILGAGLAATGIGAPMAALLVGGGTAVASGSLEKGLMAGLGAYGGAGIGQGISPDMWKEGLAGPATAPNMAPVVDGVATPVEAAASNAASAAPPADVTVGGPMGASAGPVTTTPLPPASSAASSGRAFADLGGDKMYADLGGDMPYTPPAAPAPTVTAPTQMAAANPLDFGAGTAPTPGPMSLTDTLQHNANWKNVGAAMSPLIAEATKPKPPPTTAVDKDPGQRYSYSPGRVSPTPSPDLSGSGQEYFNPSYTMITPEEAKRLYGHADGGMLEERTPSTRLPVEKMSDANSVGANTGYPGSAIQQGGYATPWETPISRNVVADASDANVNMFTGEPRGYDGGGQVELHGTIDLGNDNSDKQYGGDYTPVANGFGGQNSSASADNNTNTGTADTGGYDPKAIAADPAGFFTHVLQGAMENRYGNGNPFLPWKTAQQGTIAGTTGAGNTTAADATDVGTQAASGIAAQGIQFAKGGLSDLGGYSDGGRLLRGPGDGVSDSIPAVIGRKQPARLADGEFVVPARIVSELGNGSTEAGARKLYAMMDRVQKARGNTTGKGKVAKNTRADKYLPA